MLLSFNMKRSNASSSSKLFTGLTALAFVILVLGTADAALGVARTYMSAELTSPVSVAPVLEQQVDVLAAQPRGQTRADVRVDVVETDDTSVRTVVMIVDTVQAAAIGLGLLLAIGVLKSSAQGHAFTADNVRRMMSIGWLALAFLAVSVAVEPVTTLWAQERLGSGSNFFEVSFLSGIAALAVFALAQVWSRGVELEELEAATV
jgi:hypothetical protein